MNIPIIDKPVGVLVSGGADSALLLYLLLQSYNSTIQIFTIANRQRHYYNAKAALDVVHRCAELTNNNNIEHHIFHRSLQSDNDFYDIPKLYFDRKLVYKVFHGLTANPPAEDLINFPNEQSGRDLQLRDPKIKKNIMPDNSKFILPWINVNKKEIYNYYKRLDLLDTLYPITRSCETDDDVGANHCGKCWWCVERKWAFGRLC
jgi:7-cyano-7-deazaguanine synthase in queuosine biosynthesis